MTDFKYLTKPPVFKLGIIGINDRDLTQFKNPLSEKMINKPVVVPNLPEPNIFFTPIQDNRDQVIEKIKRDMEHQLNITKNILPQRY
jgi:hypothetical protein